MLTGSKNKLMFIRGSFSETSNIYLESLEYQTKKLIDFSLDFKC